MRHQGVWQNINIWGPGSEDGLVCLLHKKWDVFHTLSDPSDTDGGAGHNSFCSQSSHMYVFAGQIYKKDKISKHGRSIGGCKFPGEKWNRPTGEGEKKTSQDGGEGRKKEKNNKGGQKNEHSVRGEDIATGQREGLRERPAKGGGISLELFPPGEGSLQTYFFHPLLHIIYPSIIPSSFHGCSQVQELFLPFVAFVSLIYVFFFFLLLLFFFSCPFTLATNYSNFWSHVTTIYQTTSRAGKQDLHSVNGAGWTRFFIVEQGYRVGSCKHATINMHLHINK